VISSSYDFKQFLDSIKDKNYDEIIHLAEQEIYYLEPLLARVKGSVERRRRGGGKYVAQLEQFLFFMKNGIKPGGVSDEDFLLFRPVCENLVRRGIFKPTILDFFR
jgi:hypothetical protein